MVVMRSTFGGRSLASLFDPRRLSTHHPFLSISILPPPKQPNNQPPDRDSLKLTQEEYDRPPLSAILQVALACLLCAWASARAAGPLRELSPAANQAPLAGAPFRGTAWMTLGHRGAAMPLRCGVVKPEGGRGF